MRYISLDPSPIIACQSQALINFVQSVGFVKVVLRGFVKIDAWICQSCYMDFSGLFNVFLANLKFDQDFKQSVLKLLL